MALWRLPGGRGVAIEPRRSGAVVGASLWSGPCGAHDGGPGIAPRSGRVNFNVLGAGLECSHGVDGRRRHGRHSGLAVHVGQVRPARRSPARSGARPGPWSQARMGLAIRLAGPCPTPCPSLRPVRAAGRCVHAHAPLGWRAGTGGRHGRGQRGAGREARARGAWLWRWPRTVPRIAETALCSNRGPNWRSIDIRTPAVARREDEIDM